LAQLCWRPTAHPDLPRIGTPLLCFPSLTEVPLVSRLQPRTVSPQRLTRPRSPPPTLPRAKTTRPSPFPRPPLTPLHLPSPFSLVCTARIAYLLAGVRTSVAIFARFRRNQTTPCPLSYPNPLLLIWRITPCPFAFQFCRESSASPWPKDHRRPCLLQPRLSTATGHFRPPQPRHPHHLAQTNLVHLSNDSGNLCVAAIVEFQPRPRRCLTGTLARWVSFPSFLFAG
jgi:hypothetical protein